MMPKSSLYLYCASLASFRSILLEAVLLNSFLILEAGSIMWHLFQTMSVAGWDRAYSCSGGVESATFTPTSQDSYY